jgi:FlaA1/EpsC-like NDP-sugar epimerase
VIIAIPSARGKSIGRIVTTCERAKVKFKTLPHISDIMHGSVSIKQLRNVAIEDILGRSPCTGRRAAA